MQILHTPFYIRDLSIPRFWYPWGFQSHSPADTKGWYRCRKLRLPPPSQEERWQECGSSSSGREVAIGASGCPEGAGGLVRFWEETWGREMGFVSFGLSFLWPHPWHMEVPRLGAESELQPSAYATATVMPDPRHVCDLHHGSGQCWILNPLSGGQGSNLCPCGS